DRVGVPLLLRSSRRMQLTREGESFLPRVVSLLAEGEQLLAHAEQKQSEPGGTVRIAMTPDFGKRVVSEVFPLFAEQLPDIRLQAKLGFDFEDIQDPSFDLAIRLGSVNDDNLVALKLGAFRRLAVVSPDDLRSTPVNRPEDLAALDAIVFGSRGNERIWTFGAENPSTPPVNVAVSGRYAVDSFELCAALAAAGKGVAYVPEFVARPYIERGVLREILPGWASKPTPAFLVYRFGADRVTRIAAALKLLRQEVPKLFDQAESRRD
ncbi:MAG: LysR substrate-binding domain-containing protein, partial [Pseudomonadota bacterium]